MIKMSLTRKLIVVFSAILVAVVALNIMVNAFLLSKVHRDTKIDAVEELYNQLYEEYAHTPESENIVNIVKDTLTNENLRVFIWDSENRLIIDSLPFSNHQQGTHQEAHAEQSTEIQNEIPNFGDSKMPRRNFRFDRVEMFIFNSDIKEEDILTKNDKYTVFSYVNFSNYDEKTLCLRGYLPQNYKILIQMPYAPIDEAVALSNTIQLIVGIIMLLIGIVIVSVTSKTIVKPVKELSSIAKSMEQLDFSRKYSGSGSDEIASLGDSINSLSEKLESAIGELYEKNKKLQQDIELKSKIDIMRKEFIANASHELKTPIALISGYAEGLRDNIATDNESRSIYTNVIIEEAEKMDNIIRQMLDLMELDSSEEILDGRTFSLKMLAEEAIGAFDLLLKNNNILLSCNFEDDCIVYGDYFRIYQAVSNYISNAINHVNEKKIVRISVKQLEDKAVFSIYNSGISISDEDLSNIWERFYKADKAHTREYGGTGLGLSIVRSVIELHGGEYGVKNHSDGVEFYFVLNARESMIYEN